MRLPSSTTSSSVAALSTPDLLARRDALQQRRNELARLEAAKRRSSGARRYWSDPVGFLRDCISWPEGKGPTAYQEEILASLPVEGRVAVRGPHGLGKTTLSSWAVLWFALTRDGEDWKVITTASAWRQLDVYLWPEIHKWARLLRWDVLGRNPLTDSELLQLNLKLATGQASAVASNQPALIEGAHADHILYLFDESKTIPPGTWDAVEGAFSGAGGDSALEALALAVSTPGEPSGRFYEIHKRVPGYEDWHCRHVTVQEAIAAGRVAPEWVEQRTKQWGPESAVYQNRVLGEFASSDEDSTIPLAWVEAAIVRWEARKDASLGPFTCLGVDVARSGPDVTLLAPRYGMRIDKLRRTRLEDTMQTTGHVAGVLTGHGGYAVVDVIGIGAGVVDRLREQGFIAEAFNAGAGTQRLDSSGELGFVNCLTGESRVQPLGRLLRIYRSRYDGPLFRVQLASGDQFTVTPNHNVLTPRGWVPVHTLNVGDELCDALVGKRVAFGDPDVGDVPPRIGELYRAARKRFGAERIMRGAVDFHGDRPMGEVEVVTIDRELFSVDPPGRQQLAKQQFVRLLHRQAALACQGGAAKPLGLFGHKHRRADSFRPRPRPLGRLRSSLCWGSSAREQAVGLCQRPQFDALFLQHPVDESIRYVKAASKARQRRAVEILRRDGLGVQVTPTQEGYGLGLAPWLDTAFAQDTPGHAPVDPETLAQRMQRLPGAVAVDEIVSIDIVPATRHSAPFIYTMETSTGAYYTGSAVHRNCRSAAWWNMRELLDPSSGHEVELPPDDLLIGDLTAPKWRVSSGGRIQVESKDDIRKRLGRSTDSADGVIQAFWEPEPLPPVPKPLVAQTMRR